MKIFDYIKYESYYRYCFNKHKTKKTIHKTKGIIVATGSNPTKLNIAGYEQFWHKGVSTYVCMILS